jgi:lipopolysaccharide biosynthesis glycosyltransferase
MKTVVLSSFDKNYFPYAHVMVRSFSDNYHGNTVQDFYCLVPETLLNFESDFINKVGNVKNLNIKFVCAPDYTQFEKDHDKIEVIGEKESWLSRHAMHRVFMIQVLDGFDRAIYIDPDTLILRDIDPLLSYPMYNKFMACVEVFNLENHVTKSKYDIYFGDGVFIADLNFWRDSGMHDKMKEYVYNNPIPQFQDQDIFNIFFIPYLYPLPLRFNVYSIYLKDCLLSVHTVDPIIMHFAGPEKPWKRATYQKKPWKQVVEDIKYVKEWQNLYDSLKA